MANRSVGLADDGAAGHLCAGTRVAQVPLPAASGDEIVLADLPGLSVVYCYTWTGRPGLSDPPHWDDIPGAHGSTPQTQSFVALHDGFENLGVRVFGLSTQTPQFQREMITRLRVPFAVLSDAELAFAGAMKLPTFETGGQVYLKRLTMVIAEGVISKVFYPVDPPSENAREVLAFLMA